MRTPPATRTLLLALLASLLVSLPWIWLRPANYLADRWERDLPTLPDDELKLRLAQLAGLGEPGLQVLVGSLDSPRADIAAGAHLALEEELDRWRTLRLRESSRQVAILARLLAATCGQSRPEACRASGELAARILRSPIDRRHVDGVQLVLDCHRVLRTVPPSTVTSTAEPDLAAGQVAAPSRIGYQAELEGIETAALPGGDLPVEIAGGLPLPRLAVSDDLSPAESSVRPLSQPPLPPSLESVPNLKRFELARSSEPPLPTGEPSAPSREPEIFAGNEAVSLREAEPPLTGLPDIEVMRRLHAPDPSLARDAAAELRRRGFRDLHVNLARQLFSPNSSDRAQLIEALPGIRGINARPWLIELSRDEEPLIRRQAVAVIATSSDPELLRRLHEIEETESDPQTLRLVRRILQSEPTLNPR